MRLYFEIYDFNRGGDCGEIEFRLGVFLNREGICVFMWKGNKEKSMVIKEWFVIILGIIGVKN